jgi:UDP-N-acetylglucosamine 2-epimerase
LWPGQDAGAGIASKALRAWQGRVHTVRSLPPSRFLRLLTQAACLIGNSSAGIREASYLGVPVVNIGTRQHGRERGPNVIDVPHDAVKIANALSWQIAHGPYPSSSLYGKGNAGQRIAEVLVGQCTRHHSSAVRE